MFARLRAWVDRILDDGWHDIDAPSYAAPDEWADGDEDADH